MGLGFMLEHLLADSICMTVPAWLGSPGKITAVTGGALMPNTSLNHRTHYGGPAWPGLGYAVHFPNPGQAVPP
jgi:hypothetical protein